VTNQKLETEKNNDELDVIYAVLTDRDDLTIGLIIRLEGGASSLPQGLRFYDYIVSFIYDNNDFLQLTCLAQGEGGNIICILQREPNTNYSLGIELKRMMDDGTNLVFVNFSPNCIVN